jgi:hypothetical protein
MSPEEQQRMETLEHAVDTLRLRQIDLEQLAAKQAGTVADLVNRIESLEHPGRAKWFGRHTNTIQNR